MKITKWFVVLLIVAISRVGIATTFNSLTDCKKTLKYGSTTLATLQTIFDNYTDTSKYSKQLDDGTYTLCFDSLNSYCESNSATNTCDKAFTITSKLDASGNPAPLLIYGLNLKMASAPAGADTPCTSALITISGAGGVTLQNATFVGPDACTGIKINAKDVTIDTVNISKFATAIETTANSENVSVKNSSIEIPDGTGMTGVLLAGKGQVVDGVAITGPGSGTAIQVNGTAAVENSALSNFTEGIKIAKDANALVTQGKFTNVTTPIAYEIPAFAGMTGEGVISADWFGKHISEADANKVDRIAGKLALADCGGSVEIYLFKAPEQVGQQQLLTYHTTCPVAELKDKPLKLTSGDGSEKEIAVGSCYFNCNELTDVLKDNYISFLYSSSGNQTAEFNPMPAVKISDLMDVISTGAIPATIAAPIGGGMDGADSGTTVYVQGYETGSNDVLVDPNVLPPENVLEPPADDKSGEKNLVTQGVSASPIGGCS